MMWIENANTNLLKCVLPNGLLHGCGYQDTVLAASVWDFFSIRDPYHKATTSRKADPCQRPLAGKSFITPKRGGSLLEVLIFSASSPATWRTEALSFTLCIADVRKLTQICSTANGFALRFEATLRNQ